MWEPLATLLHSFNHREMQEGFMNSIIYVVGLVVVVGAILSFIGFHG